MFFPSSPDTILTLDNTYLGMPKYINQSSAKSCQPMYVELSDKNLKKTHDVFRPQGRNSQNFLRQIHKNCRNFEML
jgi:hypothetical protein